MKNRYFSLFSTCPLTASRASGLNRFPPALWKNTPWKRSDWSWRCEARTTVRTLLWSRSLSGTPSSRVPDSTCTSTACSTRRRRRRNSWRTPGRGSTRPVCRHCETINEKNDWLLISQVQFVGCSSGASYRFSPAISLRKYTKHPFFNEGRGPSTNFTPHKIKV